MLNSCVDKRNALRVEVCCTRSCGCDMFPYKIIKSFICVDKRNALGAKVCCTSSHGCVKLSCALVWSLNHLAVFKNNALRVEMHCTLV